MMTPAPESDPDDMPAEIDFSKGVRGMFSPKCDTERSQALARLLAVADAMAAAGIAPMSMEEINAEVKAVRAERKRLRSDRSQFTETQGAQAPAGGVMTTVEINLPDELARNAQQAGLLKPEAIETMLREQLKKQAIEDLQAMWANGPSDELTPEAEQLIAEAVEATRAERRQRAAS